MPLFIASTALLLLLAIAAIVLPLLRKSAADAVVGRDEANLQILRDQLVELDADLNNGVLSGEQYESARAELERRVLDESQKGGAAAQRTQTGRRWLAPALTGVLMPVVAIALYSQLGSNEGLDVDAYVQRQASEITPDKVEQMTRQLAEHLEANPGDVEGWAMLGRAYKALQKFEASAGAWGRAAALQPDNADVLTDYAEALGLAAQGDLRGEPTRLLMRALQADPTNTKALALSGGAAFGRADYKAAIEYWQKLLALSASDTELSDALRTGIAEAQTRMGQGASTGQDVGKTGARGRVAQDAGEVDSSAAVVGVVSLSPQLSQSAKPDDTVFVFARAAQGPGMPLAVQRVRVGELPYRFRLDDSMAIMPDRKISGAGQLVVGARVSKSGGANRSSGDLEGFSAAVESGARDVRVVIDQRVP